jgi:hypothetical protein
MPIACGRCDNLALDINGLRRLSKARFEPWPRQFPSSLNPAKSACFSQSQSNGTTKTL